MGVPLNLDWLPSVIGERTGGAICWAAKGLKKGDLVKNGIRKKSPA